MYKHGMLKLCLLWACITLSNGQIFAQFGCAKQVNYNVAKTVSYAFSSDVNQNEVKSTEWLMARSYTQNEQVSKCVNAAGEISTTIDFANAAKNPDAWGPQVYRAIIDKMGCRFFGEDGNLLYTTSEEMEHETLPNLELDQVETFGYVGPMFDLNEELLSSYQQEGGIVTLHEDGSYTVYYDDLEMLMTIDPSAQQMQTDIYENGLLQLSYLEGVLPLDEELAIPLYSVTKSYTPLDEGGYMEKTESKNYLDYSIDGERIGQSGNLDLVSSGDNSTRSSIGEYKESIMDAESSVVRVFPNPTDGILHINSHYPIKQLVISDMTGRTVLKQSMNELTSTQLDLSSLPSGNYSVELTGTKHTTYKFIIKH